jgi:6-phosphogluconolactonase (cycloisomerase 2 family)
MKTARLASAGALALAVTVPALLAGPAQASPAEHPGTSSAPVFVQTDNLAGNTVVAYDRAGDGTLVQAGVYPTGGNGGALTGAVVDLLASQGAMAYDRAAGLLYAVNAGSNTVTVFGVHGDQLRRRQVINSGGTFPVSIAVRGNALYVLNARDGGSVQGFLRFGQALVRVPAWHRALGLDPTATPEFTHTPGQAAFTPDGRQLVVTTKANGNDIDVFAVDRFGGVSAHPVVNADPGQVPFATSFDASGHLIVAEAANAVASFTVNPDGTLTLVDRQATGQAATCWIVRNGADFYASNAGAPSLSGYHDDGSGALTFLGNTSTDPGTVDAAVSSDGGNLYVQTGAHGIVDEYAIGSDGSLTQVGAITDPGAIGGEGIVAG